VFEGRDHAQHLIHLGNCTQDGTAWIPVSAEPEQHARSPGARLGRGYEGRNSQVAGDVQHPQFTVELIGIVIANLIQVRLVELCRIGIQIRGRARDSVVPPRGYRITFNKLEEALEDRVLN
jgi:hypothetical protein